MTAAPTARETGFDVVSSGFLIEIVAAPTVEIELADTAAVNCVALTNVVGSAVPFHCTTAPEAKPLPLTVSVKLDPPAVVVEGFRLLIVGDDLIENEAPAEVAPPLETVMVTVPADTIRLLPTVAVNCVALTNVVGSAVPFHWTTAPEAKPLPLTVSVKLDPPAVVVEGFRLLIVGDDLIENEAPAEVAPPLETVMVTVPADTIRLLPTVAVNCVALTNVVGSAVPFHWTTAPEAKPLPLTVSVKLDPPAVVVEGFRLLIVGDAVIENEAPAEVAPPLETVMVTVPADTIRLLPTVAVNCVALTNVVGSAVPFHWTTAPEAKPLPLTVSVKLDPPAVVVEGFRLLIVGDDLIENEAPAEVAPPLETVMVTVPADTIRLLPTVAVNCVALTNVVGSAVPFHWTTAPEAKPLPLTVSVKLDPPAVVVEGFRLLIVGDDLIENEAPAEVAPPLETVMVTVPADTIRLLPTVAVNCVALTNVVGSAVPFHWTTAPEAKPLPLTVSVKLDPPAVVVEGFRLLIVGDAVIENEAPAEVAPPLETVMVTVPADTIRLLPTVAVNCVALTN